MAMKIHFLNVGHGDCTIIEHPSGHLTMIDINNSKSLPEKDVVALAESEGMTVAGFRAMRYFEGKLWSREDYYRSLLVDPTDYYKAHFNGQSVFRYLQTHPDMDHMSGLHRFFWQERTNLVNFWDVAHDKQMDEDDFPPYSYADWLVYQLLRIGSGPDGASHKVLHNLRSDVGNYWTKDGIEVWSPTPELIDSCNESDRYNNGSYVVKVSHAGRVVILPGDAESAAWSSILGHYGEKAMACDILKAAHHGRESGYHEEAVDAMSPEIVICSVGKKPDTDASDEYKSHGAKVMSTRYHGTITVTIQNDGYVWVRDHKGDLIHMMIG